jgi:uncharacterized membrane protein
MPLNNNYLLKTSYLFWYAALLFFAYLMLLITLQYVPATRDAAFLLTKQDVVQLLYYRIAFFAHVYTGMFILVSGMLQFPPYIRTRFPVLHKWAGRVYAFGIIVIAGPAGLVMGYYGNGGLISQSAFCILAVLWIFFTWKAVAAARAHRFAVHKKWMYRSYALTLSAISLRAWKWLLVALFAPRPMDVYHIVSWLGWTGNLLVAELTIYYTFKKYKGGSLNKAAPVVGPA